MDTAGISITVFGALVFMAPWMADAYMLPKLLVIILGAIIMWSRVENMHRNELDGPMLACFLALAVTALLSLDKPISVFGIYRAPFYGLIPMMTCILLYYVSANICTYGLETHIMIGSLIVSVYAIAQYFGFEPIVRWGLPGHRTISTYGCPPYLGAALAVSFPLFFSTIGPRIRHAWPIVAFAMFTTGSRMCWIACGMGLATMILLRNKGRMRTAISVALFASIPAVIGTIVMHRAKSDLIRIETWKVAVKSFLDMPFFGTGPDTFLLGMFKFKSISFIKVMSNISMWQDGAHNDLLQVAATMGVCGLIAYVWLNIGIFKMVMFERDYCSDARRIPVAGAVVAAFSCAKTNSLPMPVIAILAMLVGSISFRMDAKAVRNTNTVKGVAISMLTIFFGLIFAASVADAKFLKASSQIYRGDIVNGSRSLKAAMVLNPWEMAYREAAMNSLMSISNIMPKERLEENEYIAMTNVQMHPMNARAMLGLGLSRAMIATHTDHSRAEDAIATLWKAHEMAPAETTSLWYLMFTAYVNGFKDDMDRAAVLFRELNQVFRIKDDKIFQCAYCNRAWSQHIIRGNYGR